MTLRQLAAAEFVALWKTLTEECGIPTDKATELEEQERAHALRHRKPVPTQCVECGKPCMLLPNGATCRFCEACKAQHVKDMAGDWDA